MLVPYADIISKGLRAYTQIVGLSGHYDGISETVLNKGILKNASVAYTRRSVNVLRF